MDIKFLIDAFSAIHEVEFAVLVGSQATDNNGPESDWDFAVYWNYGLGFLEQLAATERLRKHLSTTLNIDNSCIDIIDLHTAGLAMRSAVAEDGIILKGSETLAWCHFLQRTWRELEEVYWEEIYAA